MVKPRVLLASSLCILHCALLEATHVDACSLTAGKGREKVLSIRSRRNQSGDWITTCHALQGFNNSTEWLTIDLKQRVVECDGKEVLHIYAVLGDDSVMEHSGRLAFYPIGGRNTVVMKHGITAYRKNADREQVGGGLLTNRALKPEELFEVKLEKNINVTTPSINIGVTTANPNDLDFPDTMSDIGSGTWIMYSNKVMVGNKVTKEYYGRDIRTLQVGDLLGVVRKYNGELHMYINRIDQGVAAVDIPYVVYGLLELRGKVVQASIIDNTYINVLP